MMRIEVGRRIRQCREMRGLSQKQLAEKIGASNVRVSNWEKGINRPNVDMLAAICQVLEVSADALLGLQLPGGGLTLQEMELIRQYRGKRERQQAVRYVLGMEE